jgi:hypothetical protein
MQILSLISFIGGMLPASGVALPDLLYLLFTTMNRQIYLTNACLYIVATQFATGVEAEDI